jgi:hypothetical protein
VGPPRGAVRFGDLRRTEPFNRAFGGVRGRPIDRYYIDEFLRPLAGEITGAVLEIAEPLYTRRFGTEVSRSEVLHISDGGDPVTMVADLTRPHSLPSGEFDCILITQTLPFIYDVPAAIESLHRLLKPGGVVLATACGISQLSRYDMDRWGHYWSFTSLSLRKLFEARFGSGNVEIRAFGNVLSATAFLYGMAAQELTSAELSHHDRDYEVLIAVRAVKGEFK